MAKTDCWAVGRVERKNLLHADMLRDFSVVLPRGLRFSANFHVSRREADATFRQPPAAQPSFPPPFRFSVVADFLTV